MSERRALLVGIDRYPGHGPEAQLQGAERDVEQMADLLTDRFGFPAQGLRLLRGEEASRRRIVAAMEDLVETVGKGDVVAFHWSGHGSRITDREGDEPEGLDETLVPVDSSREGPCLDITDDEIRWWLARLEARGGLVTLILDCCHSGHAHRLGRLRARRVAADRRPAHRLPPSPVPSGDGQGGWLPRPRRHLLLAACRDDQLAYERPLEAGGVHGHWTYALLRALHACEPEATAEEIFERAQRRVLLECPGQEPLLDGQGSRLIFGAQARPRRRYLILEAWDDARRTGRLAGGAIHGLVAGSEWDVQPAGEGDGPSLGRLAVERVDPVRSRVRHLRSPGLEVLRTPSAGDRARERTPAYGEPRLPVEMVAPAGPPLATLTAAVEASPLLRVAKPGAAGATGVRCVLRPSAAGFEWWPVTASGAPLDAPFVIEGTAPGALVERLERRARARNVLALTNRDPESRLAGKASMVIRGAGAHRPVTLNDGQRFVLDLRHRHGDDLYVYVLDVGATDRVRLLHPDPGGEDLLAPELTLSVGVLAGDPLVACLPDDLPPPLGPHAVGHLKLFAATHPVDLEWLTTDRPWRRPAPGAPVLQRLLSMTLAGPARRGDAGEDWTTVLLPMKVLRSSV
ncbi:MAG: caspase family protein [Acidobacteriota bacterium]